MKIILKKKPNYIINVDEYINTISLKCKNKMINNNKQTKINDENIIIPTIKNYNDITKYNYNITQLKIIAKKYKIKISGNKNELVSRIFSYLYLSSHIIKIQKFFRGFIVKKYKDLHGPASINRKLCTNSTDFIWV